MRWLPLASLLLVYLGFAAVLTIGGPVAYAGLAKSLVMHSKQDPFFDTHGVIASVECHARGIDVIASNPCDMDGRQYDYPPLWLSLAGTGIGTGSTLLAGFLVGLAFIASILLLPRPETATGVLLTGAAFLSPGILLALERGNADLIIFICAALAVRACVSGGIWSLPGYALCILAALLKFYPATLLILAVREPFTRGIAITLAGLAVFGLYGAFEMDRLGRILALIPVADALLPSIGAGNLGDGLYSLAPNWRIARYSLVGFAAVTFAASAVSVLKDSALRARLAALPCLHMAFFLAGCAMLVGCFFAASSHAYRAVYLLLVLPALLRIMPGHRCSHSAPVWQRSCHGRGCCPLRTAASFSPGPTWPLDWRADSLVVAGGYAACAADR